MEPMPTHVLVTGATGNVGTALLRRLLAEPSIQTVHGVCRRPPAPGPQPYDSVTWHALDISRPDVQPALVEAMHGIDAVVHLAWQIQPSHDEPAMRRTNVEGTSRVVSAAQAAGVHHLVHVSSVGAYGPGPQETAVDETWPTTGIPTSAYSRHKAEAERVLDDAEGLSPSMRIARVRPGLVMQRDAGSEIGRYFLGSLLPLGLLGRVPVPVVPLSRRMVFQAVHADDCADAYWRVVQARATGAWNVAVDPPLGPADLAAVLGGRALPVPTAALRTLARVTWLARAQPTSPGWVDLAAAVPVMDTSRIREKLGWRPERTPHEALREVVDGLAAGRGTGSAPMRPRRASTPQ
jgi:UDP-glucose 4-epimerase